MAKKRLTSNSDETEVSSLLSGDAVFSIPYFQRPYKWSSETLQQLQQDLLNLVDESDSHFLGAVIVHGRRSNPSEPDVYDVIDGQQRITTLFIFLCAIVRTLCRKAEYGEATGLFLKYLVIQRETSLKSNLKLQSSKDDRGQLNAMMRDLMKDAEFAKKLGHFKFKPLPSTGTDKGRLWNNYKASLRFFAQQTESEGLLRLRALYSAMLEAMSVVQIVVNDPTNGPKIFDSLNSRQAPMTIGDLVRNEVFARVAGEDPQDVEAIDHEFWQPFYRKFKSDGKDLFDGYFFPFGLIQDPNVKKSEVYAKLRLKWTELKNPELIIQELSEYQDAYLDVKCGTNRKNQSKEVAVALHRLYKSNAPGSTYPFIMQLSNALTNGVVSQKDGLAVLEVIESFLVRRAICGHEPTGLHSVFKRLWSDCSSQPTKIKVKDAIKKHKTVTWPSSDEVKKQIQSRSMYGSTVTSYVLQELNRSAGGDQPNGSLWIEHILPEKPAAIWYKSFSEEEHKRLKDVLANLLPLTQEMNQQLGNKDFTVKRPIYESDAGYKVTREFAKSNQAWTSKELEKRSIKLAQWAVERWSI